MTTPVVPGNTTLSGANRGTRKEDRMRTRRVAHCTTMMATIGCSLLLVLCAGARAVLAADLKVMSTVAPSATLDEVKPKFESATGHQVTIVYGVIAELKKRVQDGETSDVMLLSRAALDDLQSQGKVAAGSIVNVASSSVSVAGALRGAEARYQHERRLEARGPRQQVHRLCRPREGRCERRALRQGAGQTRHRR